MSALDPPFLAELSEQERLHFRNLVLIRPQMPSESQLALIEGMARSLSSKRLLTLIARTHHWLLHGPILQALATNDATPEPLRRDLELAVSLFDLMHGMDKAPPSEKEERAETIKAVYQQLPSELKPIVKHQLKQLARQVQPTGLTQELPPLPGEHQDWETLTLPPKSDAVPVRLSKSEQISRAGNTPVLDELEACLQAEDSEIRQAALRNPMISEDLLAKVLVQGSQGDLLEDVYGEARWYFRDAIRAAICDSPLAPAPLAKKIRISKDLLEQLTGPPHNRAHLNRIVCLFTQLDESEYHYTTFWAKRSAPNMLRVVKIFYDRLQRKRTSQASGLMPLPGDGKWASLEERVFLANQSTQPDQLISALRDPDPKVFGIVLENPVLTPRELLAAIPAMDEAKVERLARHTTWGEQPTIREALLHNSHITRLTALELIQEVTSLSALLDILRDPRIAHLEIKEQALETIRAQYAAMSIPERIVALRSSGGELLRHLAQDILQDEETLRQLVSDRQLDPSILLRLARNKQTPRSILEQIASHPILMAHPPIMSELLLNPKTPRESSTRIWELLSESEQQQLLKSPHLPATLCHANPPL